MLSEGEARRGRRSIEMLKKAKLSEEEAKKERCSVNKRLERAMLIQGEAQTAMLSEKRLKRTMPQ